MQRQQGFSLIEVLITMLIVSIGLLGIAGIIVTNLKHNQSSYARTQASLLVSDIVDRMRANRAAAETAPSPYQLASGAAPDAAAGVAGADLAQWRSALAAAIPSGTGSVSIDPVTNNVTVVVQWDDSRASGDNRTMGLATQKISVETRL